MPEALLVQYLARLGNMQKKIVKLYDDDTRTHFWQACNSRMNESLQKLRWLTEHQWEDPV